LRGDALAMSVREARCETARARAGVGSSNAQTVGVGEILPARCKRKIADENCRCSGRLAQEI